MKVVDDLSGKVFLSAISKCFTSPKGWFHIFQNHRSVLNNFGYDVWFCGPEQDILKHNMKFWTMYKSWILTCRCQEEVTGKTWSGSEISWESGFPKASFVAAQPRIGRSSNEGFSISSAYACLKTGRKEIQKLRQQLDKKLIYYGQTNRYQVKSIDFVTLSI